MVLSSRQQQWHIHYAGRVQELVARLWQEIPQQTDIERRFGKVFSAPGRQQWQTNWHERIQVGRWEATKKVEVIFPEQAKNFLINKKKRRKNIHEKYGEL